MIARASLASPRCTPTGAVKGLGNFFQIEPKILQLVVFLEFYAAMRQPRATNTSILLARFAAPPKATSQTCSFVSERILVEFPES
jgi:phage shock protein PspC (stress-responsive transcriptional regulator)